MNEKKKRGELIVLSGPSGAGKSTVISRLLQQRSDIHFSVSFTTRKPRAGEVDGVNYNFVDTPEFERMIRDGELLEFAQYVGNYYGTSLKVIRDHLEKGTDVLLDIEVQGAASVREKCPEAVTIFLIPPSMEELAARLSFRGTDDAATVQKRLEQARREYQDIPKYDYLVVNDRVETAVEEIISILTAESCRINKRIHLIEGV